MGVVLCILTKPILNWTNSVNAVQGKGLNSEIGDNAWLFLDIDAFTMGRCQLSKAGKATTINYRGKL